MNTKGIFYTVTKTSMVAAFGEERWNSFMSKLAEKDNYFSNVIIMSIPPFRWKNYSFFLTRCVRNFSTTTKCSTTSLGRQALYMSCRRKVHTNLICSQRIQSSSSNQSYLKSGRRILTEVELSQS